MLTEEQKWNMTEFWLQKIPDFIYSAKESYVIANGYGRRTALGSLEFVTLIYPLLVYRVIDYVNIKYSFSVKFSERKGGWTWEWADSIIGLPEIDNNFYETIHDAQEHAVYWMYKHYDSLKEEEQLYALQGELE